MATKKKKSKVGGTKRKRSRVGSAKANDPVGYLLVLGSALGVEYAKKMLPDIDKRITGGVQVAGGFVLPMLAKDAQTKQRLQRIGDALGATGVVELAKGFGVLSGAEDGNDLYIAMNGDDISVLNGTERIEGAGNILAGDDLSIINGTEDGEDDDDGDIE